MQIFGLTCEELCTTTKIKIFLWQLYNNILPMCKNLSRGQYSILLSYMFWKGGRCYACLFPVLGCGKNLVEFTLFTFGGPFSRPYHSLFNLSLSGFSTSRLMTVLVLPTFYGVFGNSRNNMLFQNTPPVPSRIVLHAAGLWNKYLQLHHLKDDAPVSSTALFGALTYTGISRNSS